MLDLSPDGGSHFHLDHLRRNPSIPLAQRRGLTWGLEAPARSVAPPPFNAPHVFWNSWAVLMGQKGTPESPRGSCLEP